MRLIKLKVRNIASLKGEHEIDFLDIGRQSPLFAITGETGSGKSSILNSIGLALYGQIYKKNVNQLDIVTLGEKDGQIELIFQVKGKQYLADWRARVLKQNGEPYATPQTPSRTLYELDGDDFNSEKNVTTTSAQELLNLDFDQFTKCIILNQGEFARFLTSSFTERKEILEKLYPGEMLENMSRELKAELDALNKAKEALEIERQTLTGDTVPGDVLKEQKKTLEENLKTTEEVATRLEKIDYHFVGLFSSHEKFLDNEKRKNTIQGEMKLHTARFNELLKKGQEVLEKKELAQKEMEERLPELQQLLKEEETLKNLKVTTEQETKKSTELGVQIERLKLNLEKTAQNIKATSEKLALTLKEITLPLAPLKNHRHQLEELFELFNKGELLKEELKGKIERFSTVETQGKELKAHLTKLQETIATPKEELQKEELSLLAQKKAVNEQNEKHQRAKIQTQEIEKYLADLNKEREQTERRQGDLKTLIQKTTEDLAPIETTLKLQEVIAASEVCLDHAAKENLSECPVCQQQTTPTHWQSLIEKLNKNNIQELKKRSQELNFLLIKSAEEEKLLLLNLKTQAELKASKEKDLIEFNEILKAKPLSVEELEAKLSKVQKSLWETENTLKEIDKTNLELKKTRELYLTLKKEIDDKEEVLNKHTERQSALTEIVKELVTIVDQNSIALLKKEVRQVNTYLEIEATLNNTQKELKFQEEQLKDKEDEVNHLKKSITEKEQEITKRTGELKEKLKDKNAAQEIELITTRAKETSSAWAKEEQEQKKQELQLKEFQSRLYELDKLTKDYDLQFAKEFHTLKELSAPALKTDKEQMLQLLELLKTMSLTLQSPSELFIPLKDLIQSEREFFKALLTETRMSFASVKARLEDWEKLQDKLQINQIKSQDIKEKLDRRERLYEVLGKDELRTFVLSLVEENLIEQTNQELQKLCQGRYEILHQSRKMKITPEFYILDKFREGGLRKISTLSGGETFMVSLAMALGLAEMTRGQAEIDSLFIDEGFGTLDQDSLEDVLDMLNQIQNRGLMVGIISHIKSLTSAIPINLVLNKKQDGTSSVTTRIN